MTDLYTALAALVIGVVAAWLAVWPPRRFRR